MKPTPKGWPRLSSALCYDNAAAAIDWLCNAFGFEVRLKVEGDLTLEASRKLRAHILNQAAELDRLDGNKLTTAERDQLPGEAGGAVAGSGPRPSLMIARESGITLICQPLAAW